MSIYEKLGVKTAINAFGTITSIGGSLMAHEIFEAMADAGRHYVDINRFHEAAGAYIARLLKVEACCITCGAAAGVAIATAACMTQGKVDKCLKLPDTSGMKNEVVMLKGHRIPYDQGMCLTGAKIVEVGRTAYTLIEDVESAINENTAMIFYVAEAETMRGSLPFAQVAAVAGRHGIPLLVDAAAEIPPTSNITRFLESGADMVVFSGGKELRGPQSSGLILGKQALINACDRNCCPNYGIGRSMKIDKETIAGIVRAIELFLERDYDAKQREWTAMSEYMAGELQKCPHAAVSTGFPEPPLIQPVNILRVYVRPLRKTAATLHQQLIDRDPQIFTHLHGEKIVINPQCLAQNEMDTVVSAIVELL